MYRNPLLISLLTIVGSAPVLAQVPADTLRLADAIAEARATNPSLAAARLGADAALERIPQAGAWSDPVLSFGLMNRPISGFGSGEPMTINQVQVSQTIPWPGKRGLARDQARYLAGAASQGSAEMELMLVSQVKTRYFELAAMDRIIAIMSGTRELLRDFFSVSQALYSVGQSPQQDVLQAQVAVARMTEDLTVMQQSRVAGVARLNALLGREGRVPIGGLVLPGIGGEVASVDSLITMAATGRPKLRAAHERQLAAAAAVRVAEREIYPDLMVSLAYGQRPQFGDMASLMIGFSVPLWAGSKQYPLRQEMRAMRAQEVAATQDIYNETFAELTEARADVERARQLGALYATAILPQARASVEAALSAYRVGQVDYMTLVENEMTVNRYEIELVRITAQYHAAVARIDALIGVGGGD